MRYKKFYIRVRNLQYLCITEGQEVFIIVNIRSIVFFNFYITSVFWRVTFLIPVNFIGFSPSTALLMLHFLNDFTTTSFSTPFHNLWVQSQTWAMDASLTLPAGVKSSPADSIHDLHSFFIRAFKGLFTDMSRGGSWLVSPPGITAGWVFKSAAVAFALCVTWALKWSKISKAGFLSNPQAFVTRPC